MRWFFVVVLAGCGAHGSSTPAWPKQHVAELDGGESLAPHGKAIPVVEDEVDVEEDAKPAAAVVTEVKAAVPAEAKPAEAKPAEAKPDEPIVTEEIVIEIDD